MMKKLTTVLTAAAMTAAAVSAVPFTASAADTVYGTMQIPYADFFKAEFADAANADVEVDAVSSATANKWSGNAVGSVDADGNWQQGGLAAGTYCEANEAGGGTILGVVYPVAISADDQAFLTENYGFTPLETAPTAYKEVTVTDGVVSFGKLVDTDGAQNVGGNVTLQTQTNYGDYQITVENYPQDADTYAAIVKTSDGNYYAMRALENIWRRGEYAWSVGYVTQTVPASPDRILEILLKEDAEMLEETVVIGYGVQKKSVVTASISSVTADDLKVQSQNRVDNMLQGMTSSFSRRRLA